MRKKEEAFRAIAGLIFGVVLIWILFSCVPNAYPSEINGSASFLVNVDEDIDTNLDRLDVYTTTKNLVVYGVYLAQLDSLYLDEAYVSFNKFDLRFDVGYIVQPFGITKLARPQNSVFTSSPRLDRSDENIGITFNSSILNITGAYAGKSKFTLQGRYNDLFEGKVIPSVSYTNNDTLLTSFGHWALSLEIYYQSVWISLSSITEYMPDVNGFWTRVVTTPGVLNIIGLMGAYYNTPTMDETLYPWQLTSVDVWTYGFFVDLDDNLTLSTEWRSNGSLLPVSLYFVTTF